MSTSTIFFNAKRRAIMVTNRGKFIAGSTYNPKAKFFRNPGGAVVSTRYANLTTIPQAIRPKIARKTRSNVGAPRGKYAAREGGVVVRHVKRKAAGRWVPYEVFHNQHTSIYEVFRNHDTQPLDAMPRFPGFGGINFRLHDGTETGFNNWMSLLSSRSDGPATPIAVRFWEVEQC
jgi:hypothetical protein